MDSSNNRIPFNIVVMRDTRIPGWSNDYRYIVNVFSAYRHSFVRMGHWMGFLLHSGEFVQGLRMGHRPPSRTIGTQTLETNVDDEYFQVRSPE